MRGEKPLRTPFFHWAKNIYYQSAQGLACDSRIQGNQPVVRIFIVIVDVPTLSSVLVPVPSFPFASTT